MMSGASAHVTLEAAADRAQAEWANKHSMPLAARAGVTRGQMIVSVISKLYTRPGDGCLELAAPPHPGPVTLRPSGPVRGTTRRQRRPRRRCRIAVNPWYKPEGEALARRDS